MTDITPVVQAIIGILAAIVTAFVIPYIKSKTTAEQRAFIMEIVKTAVRAAEQLANLKTGEDKKNYVLRFLTSKGLTVGTNELDAMIEAAVLELNNALLVSDDIIDLKVNEND